MNNLVRMFSARAILSTLIAGALAYSGSAFAELYRASQHVCIAGDGCSSTPDEACRTRWNKGSSYGKGTYDSVEADPTSKGNYRCYAISDTGVRWNFQNCNYDWYCPDGKMLATYIDSVAYCDSDSCADGKERGPDGFCHDSVQHKSNGGQCPASSHPIAFANANKFLIETDWQADRLAFTRAFNSSNTNDVTTLILAGSNTVVPMGRGWTASYQQKMVFQGGSNPVVWAVRPDGKIYKYKFDASISKWTTDADITAVLSELTDATGTRSGWRYADADTGETENFSAEGILQTIYRNDGSIESLVYSDGTNGVLSGKGGVILAADGSVTTTALPVGRLIRVDNNLGHQINLGYDAQGHIVKVGNEEQSVSYAYDALGNLNVVTYADGNTKTYLFGELAYTSNTSQPYALTGVLDENQTRYVTYQYDANGRAIGEQLVGGADKTNMVLTLDAGSKVTSAIVTDALGASRTYKFTSVLGVNRLTSVTQPGGSGCSAATRALAYDINGNVTQRDDFLGNRTCYAFDTTRNLETVRYEGATSGNGACPSNLATFAIAAPGANDSVSRIKTSTQWHPDWRLKSAVAEPSKITYWVYNGQNDPTTSTVVTCAPSETLASDKPIAVLCKRIEQGTTDVTGTSGFQATVSGSPRIWSYTYDRYSHMLTETDPRGLQTSYSYWDVDATCPGAENGAGMARGCRAQLKSVKDAKGNATQYLKYNANGQVLSQQDPNGVITNYVYSPRGWLLSQTTVSGNASQKTVYEYDKIGQLVRLTQADGARIRYTYDDAHRLTDIADGLGNTIHYTLDAAGNRTQEDVKDPSGNLARTTIRVFDQLGRLQTVKVVQ